MRLWTAALVLTAIAFGSGGVAVRPRAEPQSVPEPPAVDFGEVVARAGAGVGAPRCEAPRGSSEFRIDLSKLVAKPGFVSLNTQGYNYRPGQTHQQVPALPASPATP